MEIKSDLQKVMRQVFQLEESYDVSDAQAGSLAEWNSIGHMQLVVALEEHFSVTFDSSEIASALNFEKLLSVIQSKTA